mmetsp:Transcript_18640/g.37893  ORF Transcript_18640/g.37893 Transcript_18640/m.37893 type:complete len:157 (+) Transcript_18640:1817-2287(+)
MAFFLGMPRPIDPPPPRPRQMQGAVSARGGDGQPSRPFVKHRRLDGRPSQEPDEGTVWRDGEEEVREGQQGEDAEIVGQVDEEESARLSVWRGGDVVGVERFRRSRGRRRHVSLDVAREEDEAGEEDEGRGESRWSTKQRCDPAAEAASWRVPLFG